MGQLGILEITNTFSLEFVKVYDFTYGNSVKPYTFSLEFEKVYGFTY